MRLAVRCFVSFAALSLGAACHHQAAPPPPAPRRLELRAPPAAILDSAAAALRRLRWEITERLPVAGALRARHEAEGDGNGDWMICENGVGSKGDSRRATRDLRSTVVVQVGAVPVRDGSEVHIRAEVPSAYSFLLPAERTIDALVVTQCVSSGAIETRLAEILTASFGALASR
jgi:hypothetical protein